ncbi:hypothetical protein PPERSA_08714 [Pseudocohnilembus persalinus]|uniref:Transmembrane protein n=1 Tax=Pseudocohnilembus persalinus TaxID=266149 RepID=A0A0V0QY69_PSEPJ|nr:hypothetical protein PPERSA_08714 [Pseudocohnilembus persalinus]|eukprot:KRX07037.1 hypothetical protein PPERSA_08714 [Pseudocohnilembus persalinus]
MLSIFLILSKIQFFQLSYLQPYLDFYSELPILLENRVQDLLWEKKLILQPLELLHLLLISVYYYFLQYLGIFFNNKAGIKYWDNFQLYVAYFMLWFPSYLMDLIIINTKYFIQKYFIQYVFFIIHLKIYFV